MTSEEHRVVRGIKMRQKYVMQGYANRDWVKVLALNSDLGGSPSFELPMVSPQKFYGDDKLVRVTIEELPENKDS